jgi:hypothetical protein
LRGFWENARAGRARLWKGGGERREGGKERKEKSGDPGGEREREGERRKERRERERERDRQAQGEKREREGWVGRKDSSLLRTPGGKLRA